LKLLNKHNKLELVIADKLVDSLGKLGIKNYPNEFGGFLVGNYAEDFKTVFVTDFILPKKYRGSPAGFERSVVGLEKKFKEIFDQKKQYFIGEWHTHPDGSTMYSRTDLNAMINTAECETVMIKNPILLIMSVTRKRVTRYTFYLYENRGLFVYE
jgi:[CysO sulfur-carrier protein]-S-L-cysteine hydrolase